MKVNFYATLRQIVGKKTVELEAAEATTVQHLLDQVMESYPCLRGELLDENGKLYGHVHIFINGRDIPYLEQAMDTHVSPEDTVNIFPAVGGG